MTITEEIQQAILTLPDRVWEAAYDAGGQVRPGAWAAEVTGLRNLPLHGFDQNQVWCELVAPG